MKDKLRFELVEPAHEEQALRFRQAFFEGGEPTLHGGAGLGTTTDFAAWARQNALNRSEETVESGLVPASTFFALLDGEIVGVIDIRHRLNEYLEKAGGHIGYSVHPAHRRRGIAKAMLVYGVAFLKEMGTRRVLVTCNEDNEASFRTILSCGGKQENMVKDGETYTRRCWIES